MKANEATYTFAGVAKILEVPETKLRYWAQVGLVGPSVKKAGRQLFTFQDLVSVKAAKELTERGVKPAQIRRALDTIRTTLPQVDRPIDRIRLAFDGETLVVLDEAGAFEPTGQKIFGFGLADLAERVSTVRAMTPAAPDEAKPRSAYEWFVEGTRLEGESRDEEAVTCFRKALSLDAGLAAAHTNLGNIAYRAGDAHAARESYEQALALDPDQPEARFNLANLCLEAGDLELAVAELRRVLQYAPDFADAHYNLAVALERLGGRAQARAHLEKYLGLESDQALPWADQARRLIAKLADSA